MSKYDWSNVPDEVQWIATDADGVKSGYSKKPYRSKGTVWLCNKYYPDSWVCNIYPFKYHPNNDHPDWKSSIEERPK